MIWFLAHWRLTPQTDLVRTRNAYFIIAVKDIGLGEMVI
jgi:hypothetical protein